MPWLPRAIRSLNNSLLRPLCFGIVVDNCLRRSFRNHWPQEWFAGRLVTRIAGFQHCLIGGDKLDAVLVADGLPQFLQTGFVDAVEDGIPINVGAIGIFPYWAHTNRPSNMLARLIQIKLS